MVVPHARHANGRFQRRLHAHRLLPLTCIKCSLFGVRKQFEILSQDLRAQNSEAAREAKAGTEATTLQAKAEM